MTQDHTGDERGRVVTRFIPVPKSVSAEAQQFLRMDLAALAGGATQEPAREDIDAWRSRIKATNEGLMAALEMRGASVPLTVERITVGDIPVFVLTPDAIAGDAKLPIYLDIHGGGFFIGGGDACLAMAKGMVGQSRMCTWSVDYRMPPDHPYPASLDDCVDVYRRLLDLRAPDQIVVGGASAGGNLAAALMLRARDAGLPMPAALILQTPEVDLTESGDSFATNLGLDNVLTASLAGSIALYAGDHDLTDPYLSPLFGDVSAFPPTLLQAGTRDLFLSNTVRLHRKLRAAGVDAELHVFEAMPHGGFFGAPEDEELAREVRHFIASHLPSSED